jgi:hypothetical protein
MSGWLVFLMVVAAFIAIGVSKGSAMALSYLGLSIGLSISAILFTLAFKIWRYRK